jgi:hypothetical protein
MEPYTDHLVPGGFPGDTLRRTWPFYKDLRYPFLYVKTPNLFLQYADEDNGRYSNGILTSWQPSPQSIPVHADAILLKDSWVITSQPQLLPTDHPQGEISHSFEEYLTTLPEWDRSLFDEIIMAHSCYEIIALLRNALDATPDDTTAPYSLLVSDGLAGDGSMSFGWAFSMPDGRILARCSGPAPGHQSSFRSEGYGMLSAVRFLHHLFLFSQDIFIGPFQFVTNNQGLITRVQNQPTYAESYPNSTLKPD